MKRLSVIVFLLVTTATASATVTTSLRTAHFAPTVSTSTFTIPFHFVAKEHLRVVRTLESTGVETTLTLGQHYTVTLPSGSASGRVTLSTAIDSSYELDITRVIPVTQTTSFISEGAYSAKRHEDAFDKLTMLIQQIQDAVAGDEAAITAHEGEGDPHDQYALLPGRAGGQHLRGGTASGENLQLSSTAHATKGKVIFGTAGTSAYDETNDRLGIGTASPTSTLHIIGDALVTDDILVAGGMVVGFSGTPVDGALLVGNADFSLKLVGGNPTISFDDTDDDDLVFDILNNDLEFRIAGTDEFKISGTRVYVADKLGINTTSPSYALDVAGSALFDEKVLITAQTSGGVDAGAIQPVDASTALTLSGAEISQSPTSASRASITVYGNTWAEADRNNTIHMRAPGTAADIAIDIDAGNGATRFLAAQGVILNRPVIDAGASTDLESAIGQHCGGVVYTDNDEATIYLPCAPPVGCEITAINSAASGAANIKLLVGQTCTTDEIKGVCSNSAADVALAITGAGYANNTQVTANTGDSITVVYRGAPVEWFVTGCTGIWEDI
jgi:hypothetical protein